MKARWIWAALVWTACGGEVGLPDAGLDAASRADAGADAARFCEQQSDCDDGVYCNGLEQCVDNACRSDEPPCSAAEECVEAESECRSVDCAGANADRDTDNHRSMACGGDDCDDDDGNRFPGNPEICDAAGHDEDCLPHTVGLVDADMDGAVTDACCNGEVCGPDCDDADPSVRAGATEACDEVDNDCDDMVDEGLPLMRCYLDEDGDGYGVTDVSEMRCACGSGWAVMPGDCADWAADAHPDATWRVGGYCDPPPPAICAIGTRNGDWNCDGVAERRWAATCDGFYCNPFDCASCACWETTAVPACDAPPASLRVWTADCTQVTVSGQQQCR